MPVDPRRVQAIFLAAVEYREPTERSAVLDRECAGDQELRRRVESLLQANDEPDDFLDRPVVDLAGPLGPDFLGPGGCAADVQGAGSAPNDASVPACEPEPGETVPRPAPPPLTEGPGATIGGYQLAPQDRRGGHGRRVHGRATEAGQAEGRAQDHQARHGFRAGDRPVRGRTSSVGPHEPPQHRPGARGGDDRRRQALLRHGACRGRLDHGTLRPQQAHDQGSSRAVHSRLPGDPACPPERDHPPRHQALERHGHPLRRRAGRQGDRLRRRQGDRAGSDRADDVHAVRLGRRHVRVHESRAGRAEPAGRRHPERHLLARGAPLRTADGNHSVRAQEDDRGDLRRRPPPDPRGGSPQAQQPSEGVERGTRRDLRPPQIGACASDQAGAGRARLDRHEGDREGSDPPLRDGQCARPRHPALSRWRRRRSLPAVDRIPDEKVRREEPRGAR